jgi:hypothetical protein
MRAPPTEAEETNWLSVIGRALAFVCLSQGDLRDKSLAAQGEFLEALGMSRREAAWMLGTTEETLRTNINRARKSKGRRRGQAKGGRRKQRP